MNRLGKKSHTLQPMSKGISIHIHPSKGPMMAGENEDEYNETPAQEAAESPSQEKMEQNMGMEAPMPSKKKKKVMSKGY